MTGIAKNIGTWGQLLLLFENSDVWLREEGKKKEKRRGFRTHPWLTNYQCLWRPYLTHTLTLSWEDQSSNSSINGSLPFLHFFITHKSPSHLMHFFPLSFSLRPKVPELTYLFTRLTNLIKIKSPQIGLPLHEINQSSR